MADNVAKQVLQLGYTADIRSLFGKAKFNTMAELDQIRSKMHDKRAYPNKKIQ